MDAGEMNQKNQEYVINAIEVKLIDLLSHSVDLLSLVFVLVVRHPLIILNS
ncbi:hypothetical protein MHBO_004732 [Bonamia ostreae]|uniref:Uncharacterized protein n=1 Tax=Bonamia ostreae TaxID=126728 RepID=A0ABV2AUS4_9EUKA